MMNSRVAMFTPINKTDLYSSRDGWQVDGDKVRMFATRKKAERAARLIHWPLKTVEKVHTRFAGAWALNAQYCGFLTREGFAKLYYEVSPDGDGSDL